MTMLDYLLIIASTPILVMVMAVAAALIMGSRS